LKASSKKFGRGFFLFYVSARVSALGSGAELNSK
jgi:hypothetical protein